MSRSILIIAETYPFTDPAVLSVTHLFCTSGKILNSSRRLVSH